jgi:pimeloyl-ACP methyl ester carboxylesterase
MAKVIPVIFSNSDGYKLFGMLHEPASINKDLPAVVLLSPGVKTRVAPHRLYNKMAASFTDAGFRVLRFDFYGLGDAEGEVEEEYLADLYGTVSVGRYIDDTQAALAWMQKEHGISKFVIGGLCGGAITGLLAGANDNRVVGLLALGIPVISYSPNIDRRKYLTQGQIRNLRKGYIQKLFDPKSWIRLLTFRSDFRVIGKVLRQIFKEKAKTPVPLHKQPAQDPSAQEDNLNELFPPAFFNMAERGAKMLLIFSGADRLAHEYSEKFATRYANELEKHRNAFELSTIENANHILSSKEWQQQMLSIAGKWLGSNFT